MAVDGGAGNDEVTNEGVINGSVWLSQGNDTFTQRGSGTVSGVVDGGDDMDTLIADLSANQTMDGDQFDNFEKLQIKEGGGRTYHSQYLVGWFERVPLRNGGSGRWQRAER